MTNERVYSMPFSGVYPMLVNKAQRKGRSKDEVDTLIRWLTGYDDEGLRRQIAMQVSHEEFYGQAPAMNPAAAKITGVVCGVRVEDIKEPLMQKIRWLDKLIDELARGKAMEKIMRSPDEPPARERTDKATKTGKEGRRLSSDPVKTIVEYIAMQDEAVRPRLEEVYAAIKSALPGAQERISWQMPTFWNGRNIIQFGAFRNHVGLYPGGEATGVFAGRLEGYKTGKGSIRLPNDEPLPVELISDIASWCSERYSKLPE